MTALPPPMPAARPCGSCPYRCDVPSGVWAEEEYAKLPAFDGDTASQDASVFLCHQQDGRLCAGWVSVHFASGQEAATHGRTDLDAPAPSAIRTIERLHRKREGLRS